METGLRGPKPEPRDPRPAFAILFALEREAAPFLVRQQAIHRFADAPCRAELFKSFLAVITGMGFDRARSAIDWLLDKRTPKLVIAAGFAGALEPSLGVGSVVVGSEVIESEDQSWRTAIPAELGDRHCGRILTSSVLVARASKKRSLFRETGAIAVDMESAAIAEACQAKRIPCAVVRAISDTAATNLSPALERLLSQGQVSWPRALAAVIRHPSLIGEFRRLARDTRLAARNLADALNQMIPV
jgi:adenosylhomocysteine nucleosidase